MNVVFLISALLSVTGSAAGVARDDGVEAACSSPAGQTPVLEGVEVTTVEARRGDQPALRVTHRPTGGWMLIYHDKASTAAARSRAACLGAHLGLLHEMTGPEDPHMQWSSVVFTADPDYVAPSGSARWRIPTEDGALGEAATR